MRNRSREMLESLEAEVKQISKVNHKNICNCYEYKLDGEQVYDDGTVETEKRAYCVLEYVKGGELFDYIALGGLPDKICRFFFR